MAINYDEVLTTEQKIQILNTRISNLVLEGYQNSIGLKVAKALENQERIEAIEEILDIIEASLRIHNEELTALSKSD